MFGQGMFVDFGGIVEQIGVGVLGVVVQLVLECLLLGIDISYLDVLVDLVVVDLGQFVFWLVVIWY